MSLLDEIKNLTAQEQQHLEQRHSTARYRRRCAVFERFRAVLDELAVAVEPDGVTIQAFDDNAIIDVPRRPGSEDVPSLSLHVEVESPLFGSSAQEVLEADPSFRITETHAYYTPT